MERSRQQSPVVEPIPPVISEPEVVEPTPLSIREKLIQAHTETSHLQMTLQSLLSPNCTNVPSVENILAWLVGQIERN